MDENRKDDKFFYMIGDKKMKWSDREVEILEKL